MFQHFVITRFNLRKKEWLETKNNSPVLTNNWMDNRLKLFEDYCFSSLLKQSQQNFIWLVFFDVSTTTIYRYKIEQLKQQFSNFVPIYIDGMDAFYPAIKTQIAQMLTSPFVITSRLDNDDSLHQDYIKEVQKHFFQQQFTAIDFVDGYTLQIEPMVRFAKHSHTHNPFLSLIERREDFKTVWVKERHGQWSKEKNLISVRGKRMWMSVIHGENKVNQFKGFGKIEWHEIQNFNLNQKIENSLANQREAFSQWKWRSTYNKCKTKWKVNARLFNRLVNGSYRSGQSFTSLK